MYSVEIPSKDVSACAHFAENVTNVNVPYLMQLLVVESPASTIIALLIFGKSLVFS